MRIWAFPMISIRILGRGRARCHLRQHAARSATSASGGTMDTCNVAYRRRRRTSHSCSRGSELGQSLLADRRTSERLPPTARRLASSSRTSPENARRRHLDQKLLIYSGTVRSLAVLAQSQDSQRTWTDVTGKHSLLG